MGPDKAAPTINVEVVYCAHADAVDCTALTLAAGCTAQQAVLASGVLTREGLAAQALLLGIWGKRKDGHTLLRDGDRVEIYRPLLLDPMQARRLRHNKLRAHKAQQGQQAQQAHKTKPQP
jgi:uncharacterized protein